MLAATSLDQFIDIQQAHFPDAKGVLSRLLRDVILAAKVVNQAINKAGLIDILGNFGTNNIHGEEQKKLDIYANEQFIKAFKEGGACCLVVSEEYDNCLYIDAAISKNAPYIVAIDPLDGSSNIDVNVAVGTIFSIYLRRPGREKVTLKDALQKGKEQIAAGYVIYGSSTMLVYTTGKGVNGFTLDPSIGEFYLSHPNMHIPENGAIYSINEGNYPHFSDGVKNYIKYCQATDLLSNRPYTSRYMGSLVADVHRSLVKGGIFIYPATARSPKGKLRLVYECNPMAFIIEQAGGRATNGYTHILDLDVQDLHQRSAIFIGSKSMVHKAEEMIATNTAVVPNGTSIALFA